MLDGWAGRTAQAGMAVVLAAMVVPTAPARAAAVVVMTPTTIRAALAAVRPGDTLRMEGLFTSAILFRNRDFGGVRVDASAAIITAGLRLSRVHNLSFTGGEWRPGGSTGTGDAIRVEDSSHISFADATMTGRGTRLGNGARIIRSSFVTVRDNLFDGLRNSLILGTTTDSLVTANRYENGGEDGMKIIDSQRMIVSHNSCTGFAPLAGYHPDCIQLWSAPNKPLQSDIYILNNYAFGAQQGLASFDPWQLSGARLTFAGNYVATSSPHSITCLGCIHSRFEDNILISLPQAPHRAMMKVTGAGTGNVFANNDFHDLRGQFGATLPQRTLSGLIPSIAFAVGSSWEERNHALHEEVAGMATVDDLSGVVPEPASWTMLMLGFGVVGSRLRRQRGRRRVAA